MEPSSRTIRTGGDAGFRERRSQMRYRVLKGATLSFNNGYGALECVVRNRSAHGARLVFGDAAAVPSRFELRISGDPCVHDAHVRWRSLNVVGVALDPAPAEKSAA